MIEGPGAAAWLDRLICGRLPKLGRDQPRLRAERARRHRQRVHHHAPRRESLLSVCAGAAEWHDLDWLERHLPARTARSRIEPISRRGSARWSSPGPQARDVLAAGDRRRSLQRRPSPGSRRREIEIGFARMLALRVNYVGELGWELHVPMESLVPVYEALCGGRRRPHGIRDFGMYAMDSLRLEKCYRGWKQDMTHEYTPLMAEPRPLRRSREARLRRQGGAARRKRARARASGWCR